MVAGTATGKMTDATRVKLLNHPIYHSLVYFSAGFCARKNSAT